MKDIIAKYRGKDFKLTPQRLAILKFLEGNTSHPAAENIYRYTKDKYPTLSFATVYNTLQSLKNRGEILEITIDPERKHYDPNPMPHHHIICTECGNIGDILEDYSIALRLPEHIIKKFKPTGNHIDFYGICVECQKKKERRMRQ